MGILNLPPIPPELKPITPYLQRAEEVKSSDPAISYWCAYHAAQLGISLKLKDTSARMFLFDMLSLLERMKTEIGPNDAIDDEAAASAYVENFALRVFAMADNEDRKGNATRATAKKFLAAANFLEVLSVVSESTPTTINAPEKIRYAKWKAADIAKAFREGRKPTPGGIGEQQAEEPAIEESSVQGEPSSPPPAIQRSTPPPGQIVDLPHQAFSDSVGGPTSPGWSTAATPGTPSGHDGLHSLAGGPYPQSSLRTAWVSDEVEGEEGELEVETLGEHLGQGISLEHRGISPSSSDSSAKRVHFSPSVTGGLTPSTVVPDMDPFSSVSPSLPSLPSRYTAPGVIPTAPVLDESEYLTEFVQQPSPSLPPPPLPPPPMIPTFPPAPPMSSYPVHPPAPPPPVVDSTITQTPEELTPQMIGRVQKHCKFAISALDYEDAEQARKELRAALKLLGG